MGVRIEVAGATAAELAAVATLFVGWDRVFSRFRSDSELAWVNSVESDALTVSPLFARLLRTALAASAATGGLVDPTLGAAIQAAGYNRDFSDLTEDPRPLAAAVPGSRPSVHVAGRVLTRPAGTILDLNGVVKAAAVDEALPLLNGNGFVSAGGDLATRGEAVVALPEGAAVRLLEGGIATSGSTGRRWVRGGSIQHHLIDPRTGRPSRSCWEQVTVAAASALAADVAAKAAFLLSADGPDWLDSQGLPGRFVTGGSIVGNRAWDELTAPVVGRHEAARCS